MTLATLDETLARARHFKDQLHLDEAAQILQESLNNRRLWNGKARELYQDTFLAELGELVWQLGDAKEAVKLTEQAIAIVNPSQDLETILAYTGNLYEYYRYLEDKIPAAHCAERLAGIYENTGALDWAKRYTHQATLVRKGEPRNRLVVEIAATRYEVEEVLEGIEGEVRFHFERNKLTLLLSQYQCRLGSQQAEQGNYPEALAHFGQASKLDPMNPQSHYEAAQTLLHQNQIPEAIAEFAQTEELAPGWFACRTLYWLAQQIALGRYDLGAFSCLQKLQDGQVSSGLLHSFQERYPDLAHLHHQHGLLLRRANQGLLAEQAFRRGLACSPEPDICTRLLVDLAATIESPTRRQPLLEEALRVGGNLVAVASARIMLAFL